MIFSSFDKHTLIVISIYILVALFIEFSIYKLFIKKEWREVLWVVFLINLFTMPLVNMTFGISGWILIAGEIFAIISEGIFIKYIFNKSWGRSILASILANVCSFFISFLFF